MRFLLLTMWALFAASSANYPVFEGANQLKELRIPADVRIGSVIYRLRASDSDHDYPLQFDATDYGSYVVRVENLPCGVNSTHCEANVYLDRVLMHGQMFKFRFTVRDTKGDTTTTSASIEVTDAPVDITAIFPHLPGIIILPESTKVGTELEYVIVRTHPEHKKPVILEIRGSPVVDFSKIRNSQETTTGVIALKQTLDFEQQNMYKLQIFALDMFTDKLADSRNIAGFEIILIVEDVHDTPPIFTRINPTIQLPGNLSQGAVITKVTAVDGDKGNPRQIRYGLVSENNPFTIFFNIDRVSGQISLAKPLKQLTAIVHSHQPILMTIVAEEEKSKPNDVAMSTTATIALLLAEAGNTPPYFDNDHYVCHLNENSPQGTALVFSDAYSTQVHDDDMGKQGVFSLILDQNNGTFEISPNVVERKAFFTVRVRNKLLLDYEIRKSVHFVIVARELDPGSLSSSATVLVYLNDVNDNHPQFQKHNYTASIPENATANTFIAEVKAVDIDTGAAGIVHYPRILGFRNSSLLLNSVTGMISIASDNHGFDREEASEYHMTVEARDMEGTGLLATVPLVIRILDVNDEDPRFENDQYHFTLSSDFRNFTTQAFVKAIDKDAEPPNNIVRYEIMNGNYNNKFELDIETGELTVRPESPRQARIRRQAASNPVTNIFVLTVRAYDLGVPHRSTTTQVRIFPPDTGSRLMHFILPARGLDYQSVEDLLTKMTGGRVTIVEIKSGESRRHTRAVSEDSGQSNEKSTVVTRVTYGDDSVVDVEQVYRLLQPVFHKSSPHSQEESLPVHTAEYGTKFYWILLIILLMLILILIAVLLCYLWKCFPSMFNKTKKANRVSAESKTAVNLHNKGVQAANNNHVERSGSGDSIRRNRNWKFYRHREPEPQPQPVLLISKNLSPVQYRTSTRVNDDVSAFIYRASDLSATDKQGDLYIQDIADTTEYSILDPAKLHMRTYNEKFGVADGKYDRRRGSPTSDSRNGMPQKRAETYLKEGNAEILRLRTEDHRKQGAGFLEQFNRNLDAAFGPQLDETQDKGMEILPRQKQRLDSQSNSYDYSGRFVDKTKAGTEIVDVGQKDYQDEYPRVANGPSKVKMPDKVGDIMQRQNEDQVRVPRDTRDEDLGDYQDKEQTLRGKPFDISPHLSKGANISESINDLLRSRVEDEPKSPVGSANISESINEILRRGEETRKSVDSSSPPTALKKHTDSRPSEDSSSSGANAKTDIREGSSKLTRQSSKDSNHQSSSQPSSHSSSAGVRRKRSTEIAPTTDELIDEILDETQPAEEDKSHKKSASADNSIADEQGSSSSTKNGDTSSTRKSTESHLGQDKQLAKDIEQESSKFGHSEASQLTHDRLPSDEGVVQKELDLQPLTTVSKDSSMKSLQIEEKLPAADQGEDTISLPGSLSMATQTDRHQATQTDLLCLLRPEPRRTKSENDDSSDSEADGGKISRYKGRHKVRTPIMEESESSEGLRNATGLTASQSLSSGVVSWKQDQVVFRTSADSNYSSVTFTKRSRATRSLDDDKKSISLTNIDACHLLSDRELYTPRSLKSRIIARRLSASEAASKTANEVAKQRRLNMLEKLAGKKTKLIRQSTKVIESEPEGTDKGDGTSFSTNDGEGESSQNLEDGQTATYASGTLKLRGKNQQLMEKKSVFTIAYDDATTEHLGVSSNGSAHE